MRKFFYPALASFFLYLIFAFYGCESPVNGPNESKKWSIEKPKKKDTFSMGEKVTIVFKAHKDSIGSVGIKVTSNKGANFYDITPGSISLNKSGNAEYKVDWIVGHETSFDPKYLYKNQNFQPKSDPEWTCKIKLYDYTAQEEILLSDDFIVKFKRPVFLRNPKGGESINKTNGKITIVASYRTDETSEGAINYSYWSLEEKKWSPITDFTESVRTATGDYKLITDTRTFDLAKSTKVFPLGDSTKIKIADYSNTDPDAKMESGYIKIK